MFSDANALVSPSRAYTWKEPTEAEQSIALSAWNNSISKLRVNAALALRTALRRLLRIDAPGEKSPWP
jgi:hypothetical protein